MRTVDKLSGDWSIISTKLWNKSNIIQEDRLHLKGISVGLQ